MSTAAQMQAKAAATTPAARPPMLHAGALEGRVAIVTGGGTGLGRGMAETFAALGARVVIASRKLEVLQRTAEALSGEGREVVPFVADVRNRASVAALVEFTAERFGGIDILVNNAAGNFVVESAAMSPNAWNTVIDIVLNGTWNCTQAVGKHMIDAGRKGAILNIVATYAMTGNPMTVHSAAAKAGVLALTKSLSIEWGRHGIRLNAIAPGPINGTGAADKLWADPTIERRMRENISVGRFGEPEEVADLASYLVSDYAGFVTGACFVQDGGLWLRRPTLFD
ncbi:MAG: 2,4-dienoyl-CoA reductase [Alphaproteobacteria bacterium]|jgi:NAD(P)-dependent dehydrogenase (short-subunit alcohol dehydrogenase family)|nr:2,4-dienoyl-CoA reductase [Alphaproteobacteria bacterium]